MNDLASALSADDSSRPGTFSFDDVIAPISADAFFDQYYERDDLWVERNDPEYYAPLLSLDRIDEFLTTASPTTSQVVLINAAADIQTSDYAFPNGDIDVSRVYKLFSEGATIVLPGLQRRVPELAALCRSVEGRFNASFQTNIYLTPANAQGFKTHYDTHDVFVLQVAGTKDWRVYDTPVELPLIGQKFKTSKYDFIDPIEEFRLRAGDLYYCPRGLVHDARSTEDISLHITFGLMARTWTEVMIEAVTSACLADPAYRENLPVGFATDPNFDRSSAKAKFETLVKSLGDHIDFDELMDSFAASFISERAPLLRGQMQQVQGSDGIGEGTSLMARPHLIFQLRDKGESVELHCGRTTLTFPGHVKGILSEMLGASQPTPLGQFSGSLDMAGRVVLAKRLVREGLVTAH